MSCHMCNDIELEVPRCPQCGRLPNDTQLAILTEVYDCVDVLKSFISIHFPPEATRSIQVLAGIMKNLIIENKKLKREILVLKEGDKYQ